MTLLKLKNLHCRSNGRLLKGIGLELATAEIGALVGAAGAGKTTLLMVLSGLLPISAGEMEFAGSRRHRADPETLVRAGLCLVPAERGVFAGLTVRENLELAAWCHPGREILPREWERVYGLFPLLAERSKRLAVELVDPLSRLQLALARALLTRPRLLLLDEPGRGLAPLQLQKLYALLEKLAGEGMSILFAERNLEPALGLADYGCLLAAGRVVAQGPAPLLLRRLRTVNSAGEEILP